MSVNLHARYDFVDETRSRSETRVRLNHNSARSDAAALALASRLAAISNAALTRVSLLYRVEIAPYQPSPSPFPFRSRIGMKSQNDAFHMIVPASVDGSRQVVDVLRLYFCTRTGEDFTDEYRIEPTEPNWQSIEWGGSRKRYALVLDEQLWRHMLITSMALNSASTSSASIGGALLRRQIYELLKGVDLDEILQRLDEIIAILRTRSENDSAVFQQIDDVEELLEAIIALL